MERGFLLLPPGLMLQGWHSQTPRHQKPWAESASVRACSQTKWLHSLAQHAATLNSWTKSNGTTQPRTAYCSAACSEKRCLGGGWRNAHRHEHEQPPRAAPRNNQESITLSVHVCWP